MVGDGGRGSDMLGLDCSSHLFLAKSPWTRPSARIPLSKVLARTGAAGPCIKHPPARHYLAGFSQMPAFILGDEKWSHRPTQSKPVAWNAHIFL